MADKIDINPEARQGFETEFKNGSEEQIKAAKFEVISGLKKEDIPQVEPLTEPQFLTRSEEGEQVLEVPTEVNSELAQEAREETLLDMLNGEVGEDKDAEMEKIIGVSQGSLEKI